MILISHSLRGTPSNYGFFFFRKKQIRTSVYLWNKLGMSSAPFISLLFT